MLLLFYSGITLNSLIKWLSMTYWLFGMIFCSTVYFLDRFTNVKIIEEEKTFQKSPNMISKVVPITTVSELTQIDNVNEFSVKLGENDISEKENGTIGVSNANAVLLLNEVVSEATKPANKSQSETDFHQ